MVVLLDACSGLPAWRESSQAIRTTLAGAHSALGKHPGSSSLAGTEEDALARARRASVRSDPLLACGSTTISNGSGHAASGTVMRRKG